MAYKRQVLQTIQGALSTVERRDCNKYGARAGEGYENRAEVAAMEQIEPASGSITVMH